MAAHSPDLNPPEFYSQSKFFVELLPCRLSIFIESLLDGNVDYYSRNYCDEWSLLKGRSTVQRCPIPIYQYLPIPSRWSTFRPLVTGTYRRFFDGRNLLVIGTKEKLQPRIIDSRPDEKLCLGVWALAQRWVYAAKPSINT